MENAPLSFSAYPGFENGFDAKQLKLEIVPESLAEDIQPGKPAALAILTYNEKALTGVELLPLAIVTNTPEPEMTPEPAEESDALQASPQPEAPSGIMNRFGWLVWTAAAAVLAAAAIILGRIIRKRIG
jgi:hypothetical protein